jgi:hypothetical protein
MTMAALLYKGLLGDGWIRLAEPVRRLHTPSSSVRASGRLQVERGPHAGARFIAWLLKLPRASHAAEMRLMVKESGDGERWQRTFDGRRFDSRQYQANAFELGERFGIIELRFHLEPFRDGLLYMQRAAMLRLPPLRLRIPARWAPRVTAREDPAGANHVRVDVRVALPFIGPLIAYGGIVAVEETAP